MAQVSQLSPELARGLLALARALVAATRNWTMYPAEHPAVGQSLDRLCRAIKETTGGAMLAIGITPDTLVIEGAPADRKQAGITEAAAMLHDKDLLEIGFVGEVPQEAVRSLLTMLSLDAQARRDRGGPAQIWTAEGHPSIVLQQVDYKKVLERETAGRGESARRDDIWESIVNQIVIGDRAMFDERAQQRLLAIAGSPIDIGDLAGAVMAPKCTLDGSPMITTQAATVLAAFRHLTSIVSVVSPDQVGGVMDNLATAAANLEPHVVMQMLHSTDDPNDQLAVVQGVSAAFDDVKVAQLLATALAIDGQASDRLATIFNTIAPDEDRKHRVLTLTRNLLNETDFGKANQFNQLWSSMEELLVTYNDKPFVSDAYRAALDQVGGRAERMAAVDLPPELSEWLESLGQENVRALSVQMLIDLLNIETDAARANDIARDMEALAEDLLLSGSYDDALAVIKSLADRGGRTDAIGREACRRALDELGESLAMREAVSLLGELDEEGWQALRGVIQRVGASTIEALKPIVAVERETPASKRVEDLIVGFGAPAAGRMASLAGDSRWFAQLAAARILGRIASADSVPLLQPLLRKSDPRVAREAVAALGAISDPSAARAIHNVMRSATGDLRQAVCDALVADRDPRVVPMLARIIAESEALGKDHQVVIETLGALGAVKNDAAIGPIENVIRLRRFFGGKKLRGLKEAGVSALVSIGTPKAGAALDTAAKTGDRMLRKAIQSTKYKVQSTK